MAMLVNLKNICCISLSMCRFRTYKSLIPSATRVLQITPFATSSNSKTAEWRIIYKLPLIRLASAFNRLKIYQALLTGVCVPASLAMERLELLPESASLVVGSIGVSGLMTLAISSMAIKNLVGIIYINENNEKLKLAYIDYWGKRQHAVVNANDIMLHESVNKLFRIGGYQTLSFASSKNISYKLLNRYAEVTEYDTYADIFGQSDLS